MKEKSLEAAIEYLKLGFSVVPLNHKQPLLPWKEFQGRRPDETEVKGWFARFDDKITGIGIVTGSISGGLGVLDFEKGAKIDGFNLPKTVETDTGGGGKHFYYRIPKGVTLANHIKYSELSDFKGEGGYVVAPPSLHPSGEFYRWANPPGSTSIADLPEWAVKKFTEGRKRDIELQATKQAGWFAGVKEGARNETAATVVGKLLNKFSAGEREEIVWPFVQFWNEGNDPPLGEHELRSVFESISKRATNGASDKQPISLSELMKAAFPEASYVVETLVPAEGLTIVSGEGGVFKSLLVYYIALHVALGTDVFGKFKTNKSAVLVIDEDNGSRNLQGIFARLLGDLRPELPIEFLVSAGDKISRAWAEKILRIIKEKSIGMVIVDSLFRLNPTDENDAKGTAEIMSFLKMFKDDGIALVLIHHNRKTGLKTFDSQEMRGSSVFRDAADSHLAVKRLKVELPEIENGTIDVVQITQTKNKLGREADPFEVMITHQNGTVSFAFRLSNVADRKLAEAKEFILDFLKGGEERMRQEIVDAGKGIVSAPSMDAALKEFVGKGQITMRKGAHNRSIYVVP